jgi:metallo-beta-lactamase class B
MKGKPVVVLVMVLLLAAVTVPAALGQASERPAGLGENNAKAVQPMKLFDNLYYVGLDFVCSYVIQTSDGLILIDTLFGDYADHTAKAMQQLGLDPKNVKYIILTHGHDDHYGGLKTMKALTGARVMATEADYTLMENTIKKAGQAEIDKKLIARDMVIKDGDSLTLGKTTIKFYVTPGHTPGVASMEFPVYDNGKEHHVFMWPGPTLQSKDPAVMESFLATSKRLQTLAKNDDVWLHSHPWSVSFFDKYERLKVRKPGDPNPYVNPGEIPVFLKQRIDDTEKQIAEVKAKSSAK